MGLHNRRLRTLSLLSLIPLALLTATASAHSAVWSAAGNGAASSSWTPVGDGGNAADASGYGAVGKRYFIAVHEVTNAQYAHFLRAVATNADAQKLYNPKMGSHALGGIARSGDEQDGYAYTVRSGFKDKPVNFVSFYDALRFANWVHNDQAIGEQSAGTTEDGSYTITPAGVSGNWITRNKTATVVLPNEDEWYKAAYYDARKARYFAHAGRSNKAPTCTKPTAAVNSANCDAPGLDDKDADADGLTNVGAFSGALSPYGTADQGGNVWEWNETIMSGALRGLRGGSADSTIHSLAALARGGTDPTGENPYVGFRLALAPAASTVRPPALPGTAAPPTKPASGGEGQGPRTPSSLPRLGGQDGLAEDAQNAPAGDVLGAPDDDPLGGRGLRGAVADRKGQEQLLLLGLLLLLGAALATRVHHYRRTRRGGTQ